MQREKFKAMGNRSSVEKVRKTIDDMRQMVEESNRYIWNTKCNLLKNRG